MKTTTRLTSPYCAVAAAAAAAVVFLLSGCSPSAGDSSAGSAQAATAAASQNAPAGVARGKVDVEGGLLELSPGIEGRVQQLAVKEGQSVQRGQLLLRMADDASHADLAVAESEWRLAQARHKAKSVKLPALKSMLTRWQTAAREGAADAHSVEEAAQQLRDAQSDADVAQAEVKVAQAKVEQLRALQKRFDLLAPDAGVIVRVKTHAGSQAGPTGAAAITMLPHKPFIVRAELNESFVNAVREGMRASVVIDGDAGGSPNLPDAKVVRISPVFGAAHLQDDTQRGPVRVIECILAFDTPPKQARVGQNVRVTFHE